QKSVEMIPQSKLLPATGYVHGGCSPFGMKKQYPTYLDESAILQEEIHVSGGKVGLQVRLAPEELIRVAKAEYFDLVRG
ncbi:MAG: Cys-tRNA(Pro) deacylase, partial [Christensenellaceae bacterium]|nr:Cys-tRNA(Pro) deacylase [Christensenellaceae bacterium]